MMTDEQIMELADQVMTWGKVFYVDADKRHIVAFARALLSASKPAAQPGYKLAPVEPTVEMLNAALPTDETFGHGFKRRIYQEMLAASPAAPAQSSDAQDGREYWHGRIRKWRDAFDAMHRRAMRAEERVRELETPAAPQPAQTGEKS